MWGGAGGREVYDYTLLQQALCISWSFPIPTPYSHGVAAVCGHPHGIACFSYVANLFIEATGFSKIFPGGHLAQCLQGQAGIMHLHAGAVGASVPALSGRTTEGLYPLLYLPPQAHFFTPVHRPPLSPLRHLPVPDHPRRTLLHTRAPRGLSAGRFPGQQPPGAHQHPHQWVRGGLFPCQAYGATAARDSPHSPFTPLPIRPPGSSIFLNPGGAPEALKSAPGTNDLVSVQSTGGFPDT